MGWVAAAGTLVLTVVIFLSFPNMWAFSIFSRRPVEAVTTSDANTQDAHSEKEQDKIEEAEKKNPEDVDSPQTTPKASASAPDVQVPAMNLEESQPAEPVQPKEFSSSSLMPPPPRISTQQQQRRQPPKLSPPSGQFLAPPKAKSLAPLRTPPSAAASLRAPSTAPASSGLTASTLAPSQQRPSRKVILEPGHSPLDWAALASNPQNNLRGAGLPAGLIRVTPSMLKAHHGRKGVDAWTSYNGKVYNITRYLPFHPGGKGELMRGAGKDSEKLFFEIHPWVNWDGILGECLVGILVSENEAMATANELDAMD
jgi:cytochrome b involved in lipid metabolism